MQCPLENPEVGSTAELTFALDWPETGVGVQTSCDVVGIEPSNLRGRVELMLLCLHSDSQVEYEVSFVFKEWLVEPYLEGLLGGQDLLVSFYVRERVMELENPALYQMTIREETGELLLLAYSGLWYHPFQEGEIREVGRASWLRGPAYEAWNEPFGDMTVRHVGCAWRESAVSTAGVQVLPLLLEFESDNGPVSLYEYNAAYGVELGGEPFDVLVGTTAVIDSPVCEPCPPTRASFIIAPTPG